MINIKLRLPFAVFTNTFYQGIGKIIVVFFGLLTTVLLTRYLGVLGFGQFNLIFAYFAIASTFADFGLGILLTRAYSQKITTDDYINAIFTLRIFIALAVFLVFTLFSLLLPYPGQVKSGIAIYALGSFFLLIYNMFFAIFQAKLQLEKHLLVQSVGAIIAFVSTILFLSLRFSFAWFVLAQVLGSVAMFGAGFKLLPTKMRFSIDVPIFVKIAKDAWPLAASGIIAAFYGRLDLLILSFFRNPEIFTDVGIYSTAYRIFEVLVIFGTFYANALFPVFVQKLGQEDFPRLLRESLLISGLAALLSVLLVGLLARDIVLLVAGKNFLSSVLPLQILGLAFGLSLLVNIYYNLIVTLNRQKGTIAVGIVALALNVILNVVLIPRFSYIGSSAITVMTTLVILIGYIFIVAKRKL